MQINNIKIFNKKYNNLNLRILILNHINIKQGNNYCINIYLKIYIFKLHQILTHKCKVIFHYFCCLTELSGIHGRKKIR
jgi:hypothetical protein